MRNTNTSGIFRTVESARKSLGLKQDAIAKKLGITQGHYSKIANAKAAPGAQLEAKAETWLNSQSIEETTDSSQEAVNLLADEIRKKSTQLYNLLRTK